MNLHRNRINSSSTAGFTLVETVIAVGIVATGLLTIIAMAGSTLDRVSSLSDRDAALRLRSTLVDTFQDPAEFPGIYSAVRSGVPVYAYCFGADSEGDGGIIASQSSPFELAAHHINGVRISTDENFDDEVAASPYVFRAQIECFDLMSGEKIEPADLPEDPLNLASLRLPAVISLFWVPASQVGDGDHSLPGRAVTTFNAVLKP